MRASSVQLKSIAIHNFKNVEYGRIDLCNNKKRKTDTVLALYGQNGSGKTALIQSLDLFHCAAFGMPVNNEFCDFINVDSEYARFEFEFQISKNETDTYTVFYDFKIRAKENDSIEAQQLGRKHIEIFSEKISYRYIGSEKSTQKTKVIDTSDESKAFSPATKYKILVSNDTKTSDTLRVAKQLMAEQSRSFIFSQSLIRAIEEKIKNNNASGEINDIYFILRRIIRYARQELFVVTTRDTAMLSMNSLPFLFKLIEKKENETVERLGRIPININSPTTIDEQLLEIIKKSFESANIVLQAVIPGLNVGIDVIETKLSSDGKKQAVIEIVSNKNNKPIPLRNESEGIKKIVSILNLMIGIYNHPSMTVAIDELDAGIFEYLLGELLKIISNKAMGQLIFTSHNLRPLETIDRSFIAFTTTNPKNRYVRQANIRDTNNLRAFYFRNIVLNKNEPKLYDATNSAKISFSLRQAGPGSEDEQL